MSINTNNVISMKVNLNTSNEITFEDKQQVAYGFLKAFYTSDYVGYNVDRYSADNVTQEIIDIVNKMGKEIVANVRILQVTVFLNAISQAGSLAEFIGSVAYYILSGDAYSGLQLVQVTEDELIKDKNKIKQNALANTALLTILRREINNIELAFNGF